MVINLSLETSLDVLLLSKAIEEGKPLMQTSTIILFFSQVIESLDYGNETRHNLREECYTKNHHKHSKDFLDIRYWKQISIPNDCQCSDYIVADTNEATKYVGLILQIVNLSDESFAI